MRTLDDDILELIAGANPGPVFLSNVMQAFPEMRPVEVYQRIHAMKNQWLIVEGFVGGRIQMALTVEGIERLRELRGIGAKVSVVSEPVLSGRGVPDSLRFLHKDASAQARVPPPQPGQNRPGPGTPVPVPQKTPVTVPLETAPQRISCGVAAATGKAGLGQETAVSSRSESQQNCAGLGAGWGIQPAGKDFDFADRVRGVPAKPLLRQAPPDGDGAHSAPSPFAECAPEISHEFASAASPPAAGNEAPVTTLASELTGASEHEHRGTTVLDIDEIVNRVLAANRVIERISEPCPQGEDCAGDGKHTRIFECEEGCGFRGCVGCLMAHESEPHWSDSDTAREMFAGKIAVIARDRT